MRGISPIISTIIILLITVSLAAAAWTYISTYWTGLVSSGVEITSTICKGGTKAVIYIHNIGTANLNMTSGLQIERTDGGTASFTYEPTNAVVTPGTVGKVTDNACTTAGVQKRCIYDVIHLPSGRLHQTYVTCYG